MKIILVAAGVLIVLCIGLLICTQLGVRAVERQFPPQGEFLSVDGVRLHYVLEGPKHAPAILLIHGASSNLRDMSSSLLPRLAENYRVLAIDRPGFGYSERLPGDWNNPARQANLLLKAAEQLGAAKPVVLGHSWAGSVVMTALLNHKERIRGGVLLSGVVGHWSGSVGWTYDVGAIPLIGPLFAHLLVYPVGRGKLPDSAANVFEPNAVTDGYIDRIAIALALRPATFLYNVQDMMRLSEWLQPLSPRYDEIQHPLLAIHGDADDLVPFWNHAERLIPVIPQLKIALLPGVGHVPHHAETEKVVTLVTDFLRAHAVDRQ